MARKSRYVDQNTEAIEVSLFRAGLYLRLSVEDEDNIEQNSIGNQKKIGLHYLKDKSDIVLVKTYTDNGFTGMNFNRPDFTEMMSDLQKGLINCVIVKDISRLGRHFLQTSEYVEKIFPGMGVRLICINDSFDSIEENADTSHLMLPIKMVMNDTFVKDISKKIRSSITSKMNAGEFLPPAGSIAYGYLRNPKENTFDIDPEVAEVVVRIYEMRSEGMKYNTIAKVLNSEEIPSPGRLRFLRGITVNPKFEKAEWTRKAIRKICADQVYIGYRIHGRIKRDKLGAEKTRRAESEWTVIENAHPPIIARELFEKVQDVNKEEALLEKKKITRAEVGEDFRDVFRGKVICGECKSEMKAGKVCARQNAKSASSIFYDCGQYRGSQHRRCSSHYIRQEALLHSVKKLLDKQIAISEDLERFLDDVKGMPKVTNYQLRLQKQLLGIQKKRENTEEKMEHMLIDLMEGTIDRDMYEYAKQQYTEKRDQLLMQENEISVAIGEMKNAVHTAEKWVQAIREYQELPELNRELMDELVEYIEVFSSREIEVHLSYSDPFKALKEYLDQIPEVMKDAG